MLYFWILQLPFIVLIAYGLYGIIKQIIFFIYYNKIHNYLDQVAINDPRKYLEAMVEVRKGNAEARSKDLYEYLKKKNNF